MSLACLVVRMTGRAVHYGEGLGNSRRLPQHRGGRLRWRQSVGCVLLHRQRLASQRGLLNVQVTRPDQSRIGGDEITCGKLDNVAKYKIVTL